MLTLGCVAVALISGFALGVPLLWLGRSHDEPLSESDWLLAPFVGLAAGMLVLHNLIYLDVTVAQSTPWVWASAAILWLGLILRRRIKPLLGHCPSCVLLVMAGAFALQGIGLFWLGAGVYLGRCCWGDQYNYTAMAQMLSDVPYSITWDALGQRPYLVPALALKGDRIGVMLWQGFLACSAGTEARNLFEPTILLSPALTVLGIYAIAGKLGLGRRQALTSAVIASLLPGLTCLHLDAFLAQAVAVPFLLALLAALHEIATAPGLRTILPAGILLAGITALYTEYVPIVLGLTLLFCVCGILLRSFRPAQGGVVFLALIALMLGLNPLYSPTVLRIAARLTGATASFNPMGFDWVAGFGALWVDDTWLHSWHPYSVRRTVVIVASIGLTGVAVFGLLRLLWLDLAEGFRVARRDRPQLQLALAVAALALVPVPVLPSAGTHPYQFIKLLLSVGPLLIIGLASLGQGPPRTADSPPTAMRAPSWLRASLGWPLLGGVCLLAVFGTAEMVNRTLHRSSSHPTSRPMLDPQYREAARVLEHLHGQPLVLGCGPGLGDNCWLCYAARHNPVWLVSPELSNGLLVGCAHGLAAGAHLIDLDSVPHEALILTRTESDQVALDGEHGLVWANSQFQLWRIGMGCKLHPLPAALRP